MKRLLSLRRRHRKYSDIGFNVSSGMSAVLDRIISPRPRDSPPPQKNGNHNALRTAKTVGAVALAGLAGTGLGILGGRLGVKALHKSGLINKIYK